jgi:hypothetical protein
MIIPGPVDLSALFNLLLLFDPRTGIDELVKQIDLTQFDQRRVYQTVLGRAPENAAVSFTPDNYDPCVQFSRALQSQEFQRNLIELICRAFPERRRIIFIHLPKCAGTDLIAKIEHTYPTLNNTITSENWTDKSALFATIKRLVAEFHCTNAIFVHGHLRLAPLMNRGLIRCTDDCFTVLRDPFELVLSQVNYVVTRLNAPRTANLAPDVQQWLTALELQETPLDANDAELVILAKRVLRCRQLVPRSVMCAYLGHSSSPQEGPSASSAVNNLIMSNLEITDTEHYNAWVAQKFNVSAITRINKSRPILTSNNISPDEREYIGDLTSEDQKLFNHFAECLAKAESLSIRGNALMR